MSEYFPEPKSFGRREKVELDLSNYATKAEPKNKSGIDISKFAKMVDLASLKFNVDKLDIENMYQVIQIIWKVDKLGVDKLVPVPVYLSKLRDVVKICLVKKDVYNAKIKNIENKIPCITNLLLTLPLLMLK